MSRKIPNKTAKSREKPSMVVLTVDEKALDYNSKDSLLLYRVVYRGRLGAMAVLLLCVSFFVQGVEVARADETTPADVITNVDQNVLNTTEAPSLEQEVFETLTEDEDVATYDGDEDTGLENTTDDTEAEEQPADLEDIESVDADSATTTEDQVGELNDEEDDIYINEESATSTEAGGDVVAVAYSDDSFSFNKNDCTELASGSFYCQKAVENELEDALFAARDVDGDLEIFMVKGGVEAQITNNQTDDAAPFYDQNSNSIVWHRLVDDRYQIVSFDIEDNEESILTSTNENNMEPNRQGKYTVWQRWVDGGWNIILHDGKSETQITKTTSHNVAPYIHGTLVVWNRHDQVNDRTIEMYDLSTETYVTIEDPEGMSVSNPRMVFVYDSIHPNGDIVTRGYDMLAKKFIDLDTLPRNLPEELPDSDGTGETRALIQNKPGGKSEIEEVVTGGGNASSSANTLSTTTLSSTEPSLVLDLSTTTIEATPSEPEPPQDLYISPLVTQNEVLPESEEVVEFVIPQ